jgi:NitT/TauT family transport system ATP-binding protein
VTTVTAPTPSVVVDHVSKRFAAARKGSGTKDVLEDICLSVGEEEILTVLGQSGCGKTTLLNCIAGLEDFEGMITVHGREVREPGTEVAVVFQSPHLLPWRTVKANARYGLELNRSAPRSEWDERVETALRIVGLSESAGLLPRQLSGGMQQRVNIARALAIRPRVLLMDEPFGALDAITKERMQEELQRVVAQEKLSVVFITHDIAEAVYLGDRVVVMDSDPGSVKLVLDVPEQRPRLLSYKRSAPFQELYTRLWEAL